MKDEHVNDAAEGVVEDVPQDVAQDLGFGARAARAPKKSNAAARGDPDASPPTPALR